MIKDLEVANVKPSTASQLLHQMEDFVYDPKSIYNIIAKAPKTWLLDRGINTILLTLVAYFCLMIQKRFGLVVPRKAVPKKLLQ
jgi:hypothetical protein